MQVQVLAALVSAVTLINPFASAAPSTPGLTITASGSTSIGLQIFANSNVTGGSSPTGTITFRLYAPGDTGCGSAIFTSTVPVAGTSMNSDHYTTSAAGTYHWTSVYSGDSNNNPVGPTSCGDPNGAVIVQGAYTAVSVTGPAPSGGTIHGLATLSGGSNPAGTITFYLTGPGDSFCSQTIFTSTVAVQGNGTYPSAPYTPTVTGTYRWRVSYSGDTNNQADPMTSCLDQNDSVNVTSVNQPPATSLAPSAGLTFSPPLVVGSTSGPQSVSLTNTGGSSLSMGSVTKAGSQPGDFVVSNDHCSGVTVAPGGSCTVSVSFAPTASGTRGAALAFADNAASSPQQLTLSGQATTPPAVSLSPSSVTFSAQVVGTTSTAQTVTVTDTGGAPLSMGSVTKAGSQPGEFVVSNDHCTGVTVAPGATCTITISFTPTATGTRSAAMSLADNAAGSPQQLTLTGQATTSPAVSVSPSSVTFANQVVASTSAAQTVTVTDTGGAPLSMGSVTKAGSQPGDFAVSGDHCSGVTVAPGATCTVSVSFAPSATGSRSATLAFADNAAASPQTVTLTGQATTPPAVSLSPTSVTFANQAVGSTGPAQTVTVTDTGGAPLSMGSVTKAGSQPGEFVVTNDHCSGVTVAPGATCTVSVSFAPTAPGTRSAAISVADGAADSPQQLTLNGLATTPPAISLSPTSVTFANQAVGSTSATQTLTVTDTGGAPLSMGSVTKAGSQPGDFMVSNDHCSGITIAPSGTCTLLVSFAPTATGTRSAALAFADNAPASPQTATLNGQATTPPAVSLSPTSMTFAAQVVGATSPAQTVTVTNTGGAALSMGSVSKAGSQPGDFVISSDHCGGVSVAPGGTCTVSLSFAPSATGSRSSTLTFADSAPSSPQTVTLSGQATTPPAVSLSPTSVTFAAQAVGATSPTQTVTVTNTGGAALSMGSVSKAGSQPGDFVISSDQCSGSTVAPGGTCTIAVSFAPTATGTRSASVGFADNAPNGPQQLAVTGQATTPAAASLSPASVAFANQVVGSTSASQTVTVTDTGGASLLIGSVTKAGSQPGDFAVSGDHCSGATVAPGGTCTLLVSFAPTATGTRSAALAFADNAPASPQTATLNGMATTPPAVSLSPTSVTFANQVVGTTSTAQTVTVTDTGGAPLSIGSVTKAGSQPGDFAVSGDHCSGVTVAPGANCTITVSFAPTATGTRSATLAFADNAPASPQTVTLTGQATTAPAASLSPTSVAFAAQVVGTTSPTQTVTVTNTGGANLSITTVSSSGSQPGDFAVGSDHCSGVTVAPGAACTITVSFAPTTTGTRSATLAFADNAVDTPQHVTLSGPATFDRGVFSYPLDGQGSVDTTRAFAWATAAPAQGYILVIGTTQYGTDLVNTGVLPASQSSYGVPALPTGRPLYATLLTETGGAWNRYQAITFTAAPGMATFTSPLNGATRVATNAVFSWATIPQGQSYYLVVGTKVNGADILNSGVLSATQTSYRGAPLPAGTTLYATLLTMTNGTWSRFQAITFTTG